MDKSIQFDLTPNEEKTLKIRFLPAGVLGIHYATIIISSNDPYKPETSIPIRGTVTASIPSIPKLCNPMDNFVNNSTSMMFLWNSASNASTYQLQISVDSLFSNIIKNVEGLSDTAKILYDFSEKTKYFWRVRAYNSIGYGNWSDIRNFIIFGFSKPVLSSPPNSCVKQPTTITLKWISTTGAISYNLQIATDQNFGSGLVVNDSLIMDTLKNVTNLKNNKLYYWRVFAKNGSIVSVWSDTWNFSTLNRSPSGFMPVFPTTNEIINLVYPKRMLSFKWNKSLDPDDGDQVKYSLYISGINYNKINNNLTDTSITLDIMADLQKSSSYNWYVKSTDGRDTTQSGQSTFLTSSVITQKEDYKENVGNFLLSQNYPNPFNPSTTISFQLPENCFVNLKVYDILGKEVAALINGTLSSGEHSVVFDAGKFQSGIYYYKIKAGNYMEIKKMMFIK